MAERLSPGQRWLGYGRKRFDDYVDEAPRITPLKPYEERSLRAPFVERDIRRGAEVLAQEDDALAAAQQERNVLDQMGQHDLGTAAGVAGLQKLLATNPRGAGSPNAVRSMAALTAPQRMAPAAITNQLRARMEDPRDLAEFDALVSQTGDAVGAHAAVIENKRRKGVKIGLAEKGVDPKRIQELEANGFDEVEMAHELWKVANAPAVVPPNGIPISGTARGGAGSVNYITTEAVAREDAERQARTQALTQQQVVKANAANAKELERVNKEIYAERLKLKDPDMDADDPRQEEIENRLAELKTKAQRLAQPVVAPPPIVPRGTSPPTAAPAPKPAATGPDGSMPDASEVVANVDEYGGAADVAPELPVEAPVQSLQESAQAEAQAEQQVRDAPLNEAWTTAKQDALNRLKTAATKGKKDIGQLVRSLVNKERALGEFLAKNDKEMAYIEEDPFEGSRAVRFKGRKIPGKMMGVSYDQLLDHAISDPNTRRSLLDDKEFSKATGFPVFTSKDKDSVIKLPSGERFIDGESGLIVTKT